MKVYMAGPIQHVEDNGHGWRDQLEKEYDQFEWINPLDKHDPESESVFIPRGGEEAYYGDKELSDADVERIYAKDIIEADKSMIDDSDAVFVAWQEVPSCGTPMEVLYAYERDIPVVVWWMDGNEESIISPWMEYHIDFYATELQQSIAELERIIGLAEA